MNADIAYMWNHSPRCLGEHTGEESGELRGFLGDQLGDHATVFSVHCRCANAFLLVKGSSDSGLVSVTCSECSDERVVFDDSQHGYNGELGIYPAADSDPAPFYRCSACANETHEVALAFQYSGETDILLEDGAPSVQPEDLFGWLMVGAKCRACGGIALVVEFECA